jgi:mRNA interferase RelE/StbE
MRFYYSDLFKEKVQLLHPDTQKALKSKLELMDQNPKHPSLRTKKIKGSSDIYEARITMNHRMTWQYYNDGILLRNIGEHDKTLKNP